MNNPITLYKQSTPRSLNTILLSSTYFAENWKVIPSVVTILNHIVKWNHIDEGASEITYRKWETRFGSEYITIRTALEDLGLMIVDHSYEYTTDKTGRCKSYLLTDKCLKGLADHNKEYLYRLMTDYSEKRHNQKRISSRGYNKKKYGDVRDSLKDTIDGIQLNLDEISRVTDTFPQEKRAFTYTLLIAIVKKDYSDLHYNKKDGRIWNPYAQLPPEVKAVIKINNLAYQQTIDIRSCYPSLWAECLATYPRLSLCGPASPILPTETWTLGLEAAGAPSPILPTETSTLALERQKWNNLFLNPSNDPKSYIAKKIGVSRDDIKEVMIKYFNGKAWKSQKSPFAKFDAWIRAEFPALYATWKQTDIKQTGNNIGKYYETKLMLDGSIYAKASALGIAVGYEYDGMSFYAKDNNNCDELIEFIEQRSVELLGIRLVFVGKTNTLDLRAACQEHQSGISAEHHKKWKGIWKRILTHAPKRPSQKVLKSLSRLERLRAMIRFAEDFGQWKSALR